MAIQTPGSCARAALMTPLLLGLTPACDGSTETLGNGELIVATTAGAEAENEDSYSIVVGGHLYSLFVVGKSERPKPPIGWKAPVQTFAAELERIDPKFVFLLGDNTRYGNADEYAFLEEAFGGLGDRLRYGVGNHEYRNIEAFKEHGGLINESIVYRGTKFVFLDAKSILEETDLEFLRREFADADSYDHVFLMTHLFLAERDDPEGPISEIDPYKAYTKESNWNRDVVPIIEGKVDAVFSGDYNNGKHVKNMRLGEKGKEILYVSTSFLFGRGEEVHIAGDGPILFLELKFSGGFLQILPRTVPLDVRHDWYAIPRGHSNAAKVLAGTTWAKVPVPDSSLTLELPSTWVVQESSGESVRALWGSPDQWQRVEFLFRLRGDHGGDGRLDAEFSTWKQGILDAEGEKLTFDSEGLSEDLTLEAQWMIRTGRKDGRNVVQWDVLMMDSRNTYELTMAAPLSKRAKHEPIFDELLPRIKLVNPSDG